MTRTYTPRTRRSPHPTWWLRNGGWVLLALLALVWMLPLSHTGQTLACTALFVAAIRLHADQAAVRWAARRNGGAP